MRIGRQQGLRRGAWVACALLTVATAMVAGAPNGLAAGACVVPPGPGGTLTGVVNTYYPGVGTAAAGATSLTVGSPTGSPAIAAGDLLLVMQMQDASFSSANNDSYGDGVSSTPSSGYTSLGSSGAFEYVEATSAVSAGVVSITGTGSGGGLLNSYTTAAATAGRGQRTFQVIRVPQYTTATTSSSLTAAPWNGSTGGVLAIDTSGALTLNGTVSVNGLGFRAAPGIRRTGAAGLSNTDWATSATINANGNKGEGIAGTPLGTTAGNGYPGGDAARGAPGNAGAGGTDGNPSANDQNSGGGGGGNGGQGGGGGNTWSSNLARGGAGGAVVPADAGHLVLGGGGGAGTANNFGPPAANAANGGGIVLLRAGSVAGTGTVSANGADAYNNTANDGAGGGGAGGSILFTVTNGDLTGATLRADGGRGGDAWATQAGAGSAHGPGGGGGGGWILTNAPATATSVVGGAHGITTTGNLAYGSTDGASGQTAPINEVDVPGYNSSSRCADLAITKTGPATVNADGSITYQLDVTNNGPSAASNVTVVDTLPPGVTYQSTNAPAAWTCTNNANTTVTCTRPALANGATNTLTITVTAPADPTPPFTITNTADVNATTADPDPTNNTDSVDTTITPQADLAITKTGPATVHPGALVRYRLTVVNQGPSTALDLTVSDTLPAGVTLIGAVGTGWTCTATAPLGVTCTRPALNVGPAPVITVTVSAPMQGAAVTDTATVTSTVDDPNPGNNTDSVTTDVGALADLSLVKRGPESAPPGALITYQLTVANHGPDTATDVVVTDPLPRGTSYERATGVGWTCDAQDNVVTCARPSLAADRSSDITVAVQLGDATGTVRNHASVTSGVTDPTGTNNASAATVTVRSGAPLPHTGANPLPVLLAGLLAAGLGALLVRMGRRRTD